jgi:hypothetical protein
MTKIKEKKYAAAMEIFGNAIADCRWTVYQQCNKIEEAVTAMLDSLSSGKNTETIYLQYAGTAREKQVRVVYFNDRIRILDPDGTISDPYFWCVRLIRLPADRAAKIPVEWVLEDSYGHELHTRELSTDDLLLLADRLFDPDCSLNPAWDKDTRL